MNTQFEVKDDSAAIVNAIVGLAVKKWLMTVDIHLLEGYLLQWQLRVDRQPALLGHSQYGDLQQLQLQITALREHRGRKNAWFYHLDYIGMLLILLLLVLPAVVLSGWWQQLPPLLLAVGVSTSGVMLLLSLVVWMTDWRMMRAINRQGYHLHQG